MWEYGAGVGIVSLRRDFASYDVEGTDGPIGTVDESSYDGSCAYLVVDIGSCIAGKKRMIPAGVVEGVDVVTRTVFVALSRETVEAGARLRGTSSTRARRTSHLLRNAASTGRQLTWLTAS